MSGVQAELMAARNRLFVLKSKSILRSLRHWIFRYHPRFRDWRFWAVQVLIFGIAAAHDIIEAGGYLPHLGGLYFVPISLFFVPVVYAALNFGFVGSTATVLWIVIITIPNWVFWHQGFERLGVMFQMSLLVAIAVLVGHRVDRATTARRQAEAASAALRTYAAHLVKAQEEERQRIARELHDETIQTLALLSRRLNSIESRNPFLQSAVTGEVGQARKMVEEVSKDLRHFARTLRPPILDDLGIVTSIHRLLLDSAERTGMKNQFRLVGEERRLPEDIELGMFRIAQEALWNVERHSRATEVKITITIAKGHARLDISDDGVGFNVPPVLSSFYTDGKLGLLGMHERAEILGGELEVKSSPNKGVTVSFSTPVAEKNSGVSDRYSTR